MNDHKMMFSPPSQYVLGPSKQVQAAQYRFHSVPFDYSFGFETEVSMASPEWNQFPHLEQCCSGVPPTYNHAGHNNVFEGHQRESLDPYKEEVPASPYDSWGLTSSRAITMQGPSAEWQTPGAYHENVVKDSEEWRRQRVTSPPDISLGLGEGMDAPRHETLYSVPSTQEVDQAPSTLLNASFTDAETSPAFRSTHKTEDSPLTEPQALHGSAWAWFHPTNQYSDMLPQSDHAVAQVAPSTASTAACGSVPRKNPLLENHYAGLPEWNGPELGFSSSESESKPSPIPSTSFHPSHMLWMGENSSFGSDLPALTYSQASPASDWEDGPAEAQGQNDVVDGPQAAGYSLRNLRQRRIVGPSDEEEAWKNDFLVDKKRAGWTYKMIKQQGGFTEAESTLRGRYRALTKQRKDRVRKPIWQRRDIQLLRDAVSKHFVGRFVSNADVTSPSWTNVPDMYIDPNKILWKDVADYIRDNGGSYHFGNATCKKMWLKIHGRS
ncbi:hypothetical protein BKA80DRAFT_343819 [Phyllosticta citrichinensis]